MDFIDWAFEIANDVVAVDKTAHQNRAGVSSIAMGTASGRHP